MTRLLFLILMVVVCGMSVTAQAGDKENAYDRVMRTGVLKCGYYPWPPYFNLDPNTKKLTGLAVDVAETIGKLLDLKIEYVQMAGLGMQGEELRKGIYDMHCLDSYYTFSSVKIQDYGTPHYYGPAYMFVRADDERFKKLEDLNKESVTLVGIDGDIGPALAVYKFPLATLQSLPATSDGTQLMMNVMTKKADATIADIGIIEEFNKHNPPGLKIIGEPVATYPISFSVAKGEEKLLRMLDGAVSAMHNMGMFKTLVDTYGLTGTGVFLVAKPYEQSEKGTP